jgi:predicted phosphoribosyltransferase
VVGREGDLAASEKKHPLRRRRCTILAGLVTMLFQNRQDAGRILAQSVTMVPDLEDAVVLGLPRGGVPVAFEVARARQLPLDVLVVRKLGAPGQPELAMGALASGGDFVLNPDILQCLRVSDEELRAVVAEEKLKLERQERAYRDKALALAIEGRTVILVDDGLATGASMRAAVKAVRVRARRIVVAVPVGAESSCRELESEVDLLVCPHTPEPFEAVGRFYRNFEPTSDEEVRRLLAEARRKQ